MPYMLKSQSQSRPQSRLRLRLRLRLRPLPLPFAVYVLGLAVVAQGTSEFMLSGLVSAIAADLDVSLSAAGLLTSAFAVGMVLGAPLMALFSRTWPGAGLSCSSSPCSSRCTSWVR